VYKRQGIVIPNLAAAQQRAPRGLAGAALAAGGQADRHGHHGAGFRACCIEHSLVGRLIAAGVPALVLVGMLVAILNARIARAARLRTAIGLGTARRFESTGRLKSGAANFRRCGAAGIDLAAVVAKAGTCVRAENKRQSNDKATENERTTHEMSLQKSKERQ